MHARTHRRIASRIAAKYMAMFVEGKEDEARQYLERVSEMDPALPDLVADLIEERLKNGKG